MRPICGVYLKYRHNASGNMVSMSDWQGNTTQFTYDPDGNLTQVNYPGSSGMTESLTYDNADQFQMSVLSSTAGSLAGNFITDSWPTNSDGLYYSNSASLNGSVVLAQSSFSYNSDTQMTQGLGYSYSYNSAGDITSSGSPGSPSSSSTTTNYSYDAGGELCSSSTTAVSPTSPSCENPSGYPSNTFSTYSYNQDGERICSTPKNSSGATCADPNPAITTTYGWNQEGELSSVATPGGNFSYTYNPQGLRQQESSPLGIEYFNWNTQSSTPQLITDGQNAYIYGPQGTPLGNAPIEQIPLADSSTPGSSTYLFSDPEGVRITFNSIGTITAGASYDAYGNVIAGGLSSVTPFGYAGGYTDPTGLIYFVNRYYDPSTGQFLSVDPLVGITDQPYEYVGGDPVNGSDPSGLTTHAFCVSLQGVFQPVGVGGAAIFVEGCLGEAEHGQIGTFVTYGAGPSIGPGHSASANIVEEVTNASSLKQLGGWFNWANVGGGGDGIGATAGSFWGCSGRKKITGGTFGVGLSMSGVSFQGGKSNTVDVHIYGGAAAVALKTLYYSLYFSSPGLTISASVIQKITQLFVG